MNVLCYVNHYFGPPVGFEGRSTDADADRRRAIVAACLDGLRALPGVDLKVCGIEGRALEGIDIDFSHIRNDPKLLVYESLAHMVRRSEDYDYCINIEDDILLPPETLANVIEFDQESLLNEILHPNRVEEDESGRRFCVDLAAMPGWTYQRRTYRGRELRVARNPHSALLILSRDKLRYALQHIDVSYRGRFLTYEMDSALAYYLSPFCLYRPYEDLEFHTVTHLDRWAGSRRPPPAAPAAPGAPVAVAARRARPRWKSVAREIIPPILLRRRRRKG
ncbi:MAG: hypothetical protein ABJC39_00610 [Chloroflexota bacterium]